MMRFAWVAMVLMIAGSSTAVAQTRVQAEEPVRSSDTLEAAEAPSDEDGEGASARDEDEDEGEEAEESQVRHTGADEFDWDALEEDGYSAAERAN